MALPLTLSLGTILVVLWGSAGRGQYVSSVQETHKPVPPQLQTQLDKDSQRSHERGRLYSLEEISPIPEQGQEPFCQPQPSDDWFRFTFAYYALFNNERCIFAQCLDTCNRNRADLVFPRNPAELSAHLSFANQKAGDIFLGVYLPFDYNTTVTCAHHECNDLLKYTNGSKFIYHSWMGDMFDRSEGQDHCYVAPKAGPYRGLKAVPATCLWSAGFACMAVCPIPGPVIRPGDLNDMPASLPRLYNNITEVLRRTRTKNVNISASSDEFMHAPATAFEHPEMPTTTAPPPTTDPTQVLAYDCSSPRDITPMRADSTARACTSNHEPVTQRNASFLLLQKSEGIDMSVRQCRITETILPFYCGVWSHSVFTPTWLQIEAQVSVTAQDCHMLWQTGVFKDPTGTTHHIAPNRTTRIYYHAAGYTFTEDGKVSCSGADYYYEGKKYENMVIVVSREYTLSIQPARIVDNNLVHVVRFDTILSCPAHELYCQSSTLGAFVWAPPPTTCPYFVLRKVSGIIVTDDNGVDTFISTDQSMIRLLIVDVVTRCDTVVFKTNYNKLFLTDKTSSTVFRSGLPLDEMSILTYSNQQDGYLFGYLTKYIRRELRAVHFNICQQRAQERRVDYDSLLAEQHGSIDGDTASLGHGYFVTQAGEAWYRFRCRAVKAFVRLTEQCYSALPVTLSKQDREFYLRQRELPLNSSLLLFAEAHSRRLTDRGIEIPCNEHFPASYAGLTSSWIQLRPAVHYVAPPPVMDALALHQLHLEDPTDFDFEQGGIYHPTAIRAMERHMQTKRAMQDVSFTLAKTAQNVGWSSSPGSSKVSFTPEALMSHVPSFSLLDLLWDIISAWGGTMSIFMGVYHLAVLILRCYGWSLPTILTLGQWAARPLRRFVTRHANRANRPESPPPPGPAPGDDAGPQPPSPLQRRTPQGASKQTEVKDTPSTDRKDSSLPSASTSTQPSAPPPNPHDLGNPAAMTTFLATLNPQEREIFIQSLGGPATRAAGALTTTAQRTETPLNTIRPISQHYKPPLPPKPKSTDLQDQIPMENLHPFVKTGTLTRPTAAYNVANQTLYMLPGDQPLDLANPPFPNLTLSPIPQPSEQRLTESRQGQPARSPRQSPDSLKDENMPPRMKRWSNTFRRSPLGFRTFRKSPAAQDRLSPVKDRAELARRLDQLKREIQSSPVLATTTPVDGIDQVIAEISTLHSGLGETKNRGQLTHAINTYRNLTKRAMKLETDQGVKVLEDPLAQ